MLGFWFKSNVCDKNDIRDSLSYFILVFLKKNEFVVKMNKCFIFFYDVFGKFG